MAIKILNFLIYNNLVLELFKLQLTVKFMAKNTYKDHIVASENIFKGEKMNKKDLKRRKDVFFAFFGILGSTNLGNFFFL